MIDLYKGHSSLAEMINGHLKPWRRALLCVLGVAANDLDADNVSYYKHEINALDDIERAVSVELVAEVGRLEGLRALRLHHWRGVLEFSKRIGHYEARIPRLVDRRQLERAREGLEYCKKCHSFQMKQVQLLNDFFPIGDEVTKDYDNATNL